MRDTIVLDDGGRILTDGKVPRVVGASFFGDRNPISYYQSITALTLARTFGNRNPAGERLFIMDDPVFTADDDRLKRMGQAKRDDLIRSIPDTVMSLKTEIGLTLPRLPLTGELGRYLTGLYSQESDRYSGLKATKTVLFETPLDRYGFVVFATHGYFGNNLPGIQEPVLVLTLLDQPKDRDGFLRMTEVMSLNVNADIVVLTACQTGLGHRISGEGTMGMGRAFQYAGAKSVLMSLWTVSELPSVKLVERFFEHIKEGKSKLEALISARRDVREAGYDHPYFWASFILAGETGQDPPSGLGDLLHDR